MVYTFRRICYETKQMINYPHRAFNHFLESHAMKCHHSDFTERISPALHSLPCSLSVWSPLHWTALNSGLTSLSEIPIQSCILIIYTSNMWQKV